MCSGNVISVDDRIKGLVIMILIAWRIKYDMIKDEMTKESPPYAVKKVPAVVACQQISVKELISIILLKTIVMQISREFQD